MRRAIVRPRTRSEPTPLGDILQGDPTARRLRAEAERRENAHRNGTGTSFGPGFYTLGETRDMARAKDEFIVEDGILTRRGKLLLYASSGAGKTTLSHHLAGSLASALPFLGRFAVDRPHRVLFAQGELAPAELASHGRNLLDVFGDTVATDGLVFWLSKQTKLPRDKQQLRAAIEMTGADVVVIDPFIRFYGGENTTQPEEVGRFFESLDELLDDPLLGVEGVVVVHHMNVAQARTAGSWAFEGWPSTIIRLDHVKGEPDCRRLLFEKMRSPDSTLHGTSLIVRLGERGYLVDDRAHGNVGPDGRGITTLVDFLRTAGGEARRRTAAEHLKTTLHVLDRQVTNIIRSALDAGAVTTRRLGRETILCLVDEVDRE